MASVFAVLFVAACSSSTDFSPITSLTVTPASVTLAPGGTQQFTVVTKDGNGKVITGTTPTWAVVAGGGTISPTGLFTAGTTAGTFTNTVTVTCSGITVTATVIVTPGALATITVTPNPGTMPINTTLQYTAVGRDANGNVVAITPVWSVTAGGGAIDAASGLFTAGAVTGTFTNTVRATSGAIFGTATAIVTAGPAASIVVTPNPATVQTNATQQFTAVVRDAGGNILAATPVWSVVNGGGTIDAGTGLFTAGGVSGSFPKTVRAASGALADTATVFVVSTPAPGFPLGSLTGVGILAGSTVTCITGGIVNADIDIYAGSALVGFGPCVLTGAKHLADAVAQQAQADLLVLHNTVFGLPCGTVVGTADIGGSVLPAGVYCSGSTIGVTGTLTLDGGGNTNSTFVFQAGSSLTGVGNIILINGAQAQNVYWVNGAGATIGVGSAWQGNILAVSSITLNDNVTLLGRALTRIGAVTLGNNNVITLP
ncbi:MAG TPA: ice-binding family protein [Gemmatimonadaceae bacterium]